MEFLGTEQLKDIAITFNGDRGEIEARAFTDALDGLKERLSPDKFNEFVNSL